MANRVPTLQEEERPIDEQIANELISLTPESWRAAVLEVTYEGEPQGAEGYSHEIYSPDGHREPVEPSEELFRATRELGLLFQKHGHHWRRVKYTVNQQQDGSWRYSAAFEY
jgi:hypothetical protein